MGHQLVPDLVRQPGVTPFEIDNTDMNAFGIVISAGFRTNAIPSCLERGDRSDRSVHRPAYSAISKFHNPRPFGHGIIYCVAPGQRVLELDQKTGLAGYRIGVADDDAGIVLHAEAG